MSEKMRILLLNYEYPPIGGGAGKATMSLLKEFSQKSDMVVDVLTSKPGRGDVVEEFAENVRIYKVGIAKANLHYWRKPEVLEWLWRADKYYRKMIAENKYDMAHAFFGFPTGWLCYRQRRKLPYIISLRGSDVPGYNERLGLDYVLLSGLFKSIWNRAKFVVANSVGLKELGEKFTPNLDIGVIYNGIYGDKYFPADGKKPGPRVKLLTVCRLIKRKRIDMLIGAVAAAKHIGLDVELNIAGGGNLLEELSQYAGRVGVRERVNFLGRVESDQMPAVYRENDIFVMSSEHEGMSNAMLEAMASGLPIVTTRCEGVEELIDGNGVIAEANPKSICDAVARIVGDEEGYCSMVEASRERAMKFEWSSVADEYVGLYREIADSVKQVPRPKY